MRSSEATWSARVRAFDGVASTTCGDVVLLLWRSPARVQRIDRVTTWIDDAVAATPDTIAVGQFLLAGASPPDRPARALARREALRLAPRIRRAVMVPLGDSLWQGLVRTIVRAGVRLAGHGDRVKVVGSEGAAFDSLAEVATARTGSRDQLGRALEALYGTLAVSRSEAP